MKAQIKKLSFMQRSEEFIEISRDIETYLYNSGTYYFLDVLDTQNKLSVEELEYLESDIFLLENELKYISFFKKLFQKYNGNVYIYSDLFARINEKDVEYGINVLDTIDKKNKLYFLAHILNLSSYDNDNPTHVIRPNSIENLEMFVSIGYRNNAFIHAIFVLQPKIIFVPNCTYGFGMIMHEKEYKNIVELANESKLFVKKITENPKVNP